MIKINVVAENEKEQRTTQLTSLLELNCHSVQGSYV